MNRQHLRWLWLVACLGLTGFFLYRGLNPPSVDSPSLLEITPVANLEASQLQGTPIEQIRIGERVAARNPLLEEQARLAPEPDESWQWLTLHLDDGEDNQVAIELLRPAYWVEQQDAYVGGFVFLELCELGAYGDAQVINIQPAPVIAAGAGRVVTGIFRHTSSAPLYDVLIEGESEPIGVTAHHPFWSEDRQDFIPTEELQVGEHLLAREGESRRVVSLLPRPGPEVVYNLEVHREHVYQVAEQGLLVHNCSGSTRTGYGAFGWGKAPRTALDNFTTATTPWQRRVYQRADIDWDFVRPEGTALAGQTNRAAARMGYTPVRINPQTGRVDDLVLHHTLDDPRGAVVETWRSTHTRFHRTMSREPNLWRQEQPDWAAAWQREQSAYWRWRTGAYNPPTQPSLRLPGDP